MADKVTWDEIERTFPDEWIVPVRIIPCFNGGLVPQLRGSQSVRNPSQVPNIDTISVLWDNLLINPALIKEEGSIQVNKQELVKTISTDTKLTNVQATAFIDSFTAAIRKSLKKGNDVTLVGFGTFKVAKRAARVGTNPQTKEKMKIPARKIVKFRPGKNLKDAV